jgi:hypothetical protein
VGVCLGATGPRAQPARAASAPLNRAVVVVDTGTIVRRVCVRFPEDSISGKEALDRADVDPVYRPYGGNLGVAVCSLCGVGHAYAECLGTGGSASYWAYWRAQGGAPSFTRSGYGVSNTRVRDGDVEGWGWGTGGAPPFAPVVEVCGTEVAPPTTGSPPPAVPTTTAGRAPARPAAGRPDAAPTRVAGVTAVPTTASAVGSTTTTAGGTPRRGADEATSEPETLAARRPAPPDDGGPGLSLVGFAAAMAVLIGLTVRARRRRAHG